MSIRTSTSPPYLLPASAKTTTSSPAPNTSKVGHVSARAFAGYIVIALIGWAAGVIFIAWLWRLVDQKRKERSAAAENDAETKDAIELEDGAERDAGSKEAENSDGNSQGKSASQAGTKSSVHDSRAKRDSRTSRGSILPPGDSSTRGAPEGFDRQRGASLGDGLDVLRGGSVPEKRRRSADRDAGGEADDDDEGEEYEENEEEEEEDLEPKFNPDPTAKPASHQDDEARMTRRQSAELHYPDGPVHPDDSFDPTKHLEDPEDLEGLEDPDAPEDPEDLEVPEGADDPDDPEGAYDPENPEGDDDGDDVDGEEIVDELEEQDEEGDEDEDEEAQHEIPPKPHDKTSKSFQQDPPLVGTRPLPTRETLSIIQPGITASRPQHSTSSEKGRYSDAASDEDAGDGRFADADAVSDGKNSDNDKANPQEIRRVKGLSAAGSSYTNDVDRLLAGGA